MTFIGKVLLMIRSARFAAFFAVLLLLIPQGAAFAAGATVAASAASVDVDLLPGEARQITLAFKNIGTETWTAGRSATALYVYGKSSVFGHATWLKDDLPAIISQKTVKSGQSATATFWVKAPAVSGNYSERFLLSSASNAWIKGSVKMVRFHVQPAAVKPAPVAVAPPVAPAPAPVVVPTPAATPVPAASSNEWKAELVDRGGLEWQLDPLGQATVAIAFKNAGTATWSNNSKNYVSLYTGTNDRKSAFKDATWKSAVQTSVLQEPSVRPGEIGHITFTLRGPNTPGTFNETFQLAAENKAWISGGTVSLPVRVTNSSTFIAKDVMNGVDASIAEDVPAASGAYKTALLLSSAKNVTLLGNGRQTLTFGFKNIGNSTWNSLSLRLSGITPALGARLASVRDDSWISSGEAASAVKDTPPGQIGFIGFTLKAPAKSGAYTASFKLFANGQPLEDGALDIPITVTADGYIEPEPVVRSIPSVITPTPSASTPSVAVGGDPSNLPDEPIIRVGLFKTTDDQMILRSLNGGFSVQENGNSVCQFSAGEVVTVSYDRANAVSKASGPRCATQTSGYYVAVAADGISPLELTDYSRPVSWLPGANDNKFRGKLELRFTPATNSVWIINELPIEWYLKGIGETSNSSPQEYQRALLTAARTYAMYHVQRSSKHADEKFTVDATYDQVYRGYGAEIRNPVVVAAIDATRGVIVMYQGKLAITPYYSRSDGRTRSWTEVWGGGPYGWLVSVPVPWDNGRTLWGHGVGMSATGAIGAANDGWAYDRILKYFYTGIDLTRIYK